MDLLLGCTERELYSAFSIQYVSRARIFDFISRYLVVAEIDARYDAVLTLRQSTIVRFAVAGVCGANPGCALLMLDPT